MHPMLNTAVKAARKAGQIINRASLDLDLVRVATKGRSDFVTEVDHAAEEAIIATLETPTRSTASSPRSPAQQPEGERRESLDHRSARRHHQLHPRLPAVLRLDRACSSAARSRRRWSTTRRATNCSPPRSGRGAFLNDRRLRVSRRSKLRECLIGTGFPFRSLEHLDEYVRMFKRITEETAGIRRAGAAALDLAYVAAGRLDGFWELGLSPWDMAAGSLLILEAGGITSDFAGGADYLATSHIVSGNPKVHTQLLELVQEVHGRSRP